MPYSTLPRLQETWGPLSRRAINVLIRNGVTPDRLPTLTDWELWALKDLGPSTFHEIRGVYPAPSSAPPGPPRPPRAR